MQIFNRSEYDSPFFHMLFFLIPVKFEYARIYAFPLPSTSCGRFSGRFPRFFRLKAAFRNLRDVVERFLKHWPTTIVGRWVQSAMWPWLFAHAKRRADNTLTQQPRCKTAVGDHFLCRSSRMICLDHSCFDLIHSSDFRIVYTVHNPYKNDFF